MRILTQPLVHFLVMGALLFAAYDALNPNSQDPGGNRIVIDDASLLEYMQYRNKAFAPDEARRRLASLNAGELADLKARLVREDALYREGLRLQMDQNDYIIKQRLIQKMEYLARGFQGEEALTEEAIIAYYNDNQARYYDPPRMTFTHVFLKGVTEASRGRAIDLQGTLQAKDVGFSDGLGYGDRFLYHSNYVDRTEEFVASHFGDAFAEDIKQLAPDENRWQGPLASDHGWHLVMLTRRTEGGVPPLAAIHGQVAGDAQQALIQQKADEAIQRIVDSYRIIDETGDRFPADDRVVEQ